MCCGWQIANWRLVAKHESLLRKMFQPTKEFLARAEKVVGEIRAQYDVLIGVFIRQSDYREWYDGRFFFPATQYAVWMRQLLELHSGRRVTFLIASEVWHHPGLFTDMPMHFASGTPNAGVVRHHREPSEHLLRHGGLPRSGVVVAGGRPATSNGIRSNRG